MRGVFAAVLLVAPACGPRPPAAPPAPAVREYLHLWTGSADSTQPDFLTVLDVTEDSGRYGRLVTTLPVPGRGNLPHHTEHEMPADRQLFANGFDAGQTFVFDLTDPAQPRIAAQFGDVEGYAHPHSFLRLPNGHVLATFQMRHEAGAITPGGLVELTSAGRPVRSVSANAPDLDPATRVYSAGIVPTLDRIVTTTTDMDGESPASRQLQIWRLSDLRLLNTITLPNGPRGDESMLTAEPRILADGRTVLVSTFACGLYLMEGLDSPSPSARLVASFPRKEWTYCAIPVIAGSYYLVTVPAWNAVVSLDISDPSAPREASRVTLEPDDVPHWIAMSEDRRRVVITGYGAMKYRALIARFDSATGRLSLDERFREDGAAEPGFRMDDKSWPHGGNAKGIPHGAVFSQATAQARPFSYAGVSLASDFKAVAARYPHSTPQDNYVRLDPADIHDHISAIELSGDGPSRRVRILFEIQESDARLRYPLCRDVEKKIASTFGRPNQIRRFAEEASPRADRIWRSDTEELTLVCFGDGGGIFRAEAVQITRR